MCVCNLTNVFQSFFGPERLWTVKAIRLCSTTYRIFLELYEALVVFDFLSVTIPRFKLKCVSTPLRSMDMTFGRK